MSVTPLEARQQEILGFVYRYSEQPPPTHSFPKTIDPSQLHLLSGMMEEFYRRNAQELDITLRDPTILQGTGANRIIFNNNPRRTQAYLNRALHGQDIPPKMLDYSLHGFPENEYIARLPDYAVTVAINRRPQFWTASLFIPDKFHNGEQYFEAPEHGSSFRSQDMQLLYDLSNTGTACFWNGGTPSNQNFHYNGFCDTINGVTLPMVEAIEDGAFGRHHLTIAQHPIEGPVNYNCFVTDDPEEALYTAHTLGATHPRFDLMAAKGHFIFFPEDRFRAQFYKGPPSNSTVNFWRNFEWYWYPSAERMGFMLKPANVLLYDDYVEIEGEQIEKNHFIASFYNTINSLHPSAEEIKKLLP